MGIGAIVAAGGQPDSEMMALGQQQ